MTDTKHTPTPWKLIEVMGSISIHAPHKEIIRYTNPAPQNAETVRFIHRACNAHDDLVKACKAVQDAQRGGNYAEAFALVDAALTKAGAA